MKSSNVTPADFASAWLIRNGPERHGTTAWLASGWIEDMQLVWASDRPECLLEAVMILLSERLTDEELQHVGAGLIENILQFHYGDFSKVIFEKARCDPEMLYALGFVNPPQKYEDNFQSSMNKIGKE